MSEENYNPMPDFDIEDDFVADPLIARGFYKGSVTNVTLVPDKYYIMWEITFDDNGGTMSDDETAIDGSKLMFFVYLPKPGDKDALTKSGKSNKHQSKINMMRQFADGLSITHHMKNLNTIAEAIDNTEFIGLSVTASVVIDDYNGRISNKIDKLILQS